MFNTLPQKSLKLILSCGDRCGRLLLLHNILHTSAIGPIGKPSAILRMHLPSKHYTWKNKSCTKLYSLTFLGLILESWSPGVSEYQSRPIGTAYVLFFLLFLRHKLLWTASDLFLV